MKSFPTNMESTSEVFVAGLDLFYARFAPSSPYDMLPEEFEFRKQVIVFATLLVTVSVAYAHRRVVQNNIKTVWK